jgi:hypothetical protein
MEKMEGIGYSLSIAGFAMGRFGVGYPQPLFHLFHAERPAMTGVHRADG